MITDQLKENSRNVITADRRMGAGTEQEAGVVIKPVQNLNTRAVNQLPVRHIRLPGLVRLHGLKPGVGGTRAFAGLRDDQPRTPLRRPGTRLKRPQTTLPVAGQKTRQMPAGIPKLGCNLGNGKVLMNNLQNSNLGTG